MNIVVFSDSHGDSSAMHQVLLSKPTTDVVFFLGDGIEETKELEYAFPNIDFFYVLGNCDPSGKSSLENIIKLENKYIYFTHGHNYNVKSDINTLYILGKKIGSDIILFGHTHIPYYEFREGIHILNPGSISYPRNSFASYATITIENGDINCNIVPMDSSISQIEIDEFNHSFKY